MTKKEYIDLINNMTWSYSRLSGFYNCKFCWAKNYLERDKENSKQNEFARVGIFIHELMEDYYSGKVLKYQLKNKFQKWFKSEPRNYPNNKWVDLEKMYYKDFSEALEKNIEFEDYDVVEIEPEININIEGYEMTGFIDLILQHKKDKYYMIVDHKSWGKKKSKREMAEYYRQLYLYSVYIKEKFGEYPRYLTFHLARKNKLLKELFTQNGLNEAKKWMVDTIDEIKECEEFPVTDDVFFGYSLCNYRDCDNHIVEDEKSGVKGFVLKLEDIKRKKG